MKKMLIAVVLCLLVMPIALANDTNLGFSLDPSAESFKPLIWECDHRNVIDDDIEYGRVSDPNEYLAERTQNYAFEGERIEWTVLVMDKNKIEEVTDVFISIGPYNDARRLVPYTYFDQECLYGCEYEATACVQDCSFDGDYLNQTCVDDCNDMRDTCDAGCERTGQRLEQNDIEAECVRLTDHPTRLEPSCNARIGEEQLTGFDSDTMAYYKCTFTVETPDSMYGEYWTTLEVEDSFGMYNYADEVEYWYLNPTIAITVDGNVDFGTVKPGTISYSDTLLVGNGADDGSGVLLDMFITGTDFYDPDSFGSRCITTNRLKIGDNYVASDDNYGGNDCDIGFEDEDDHICYYATQGSYSTQNDPRNDDEGYVGIVYGDTFVRDFYNDAEIIQSSAKTGPYYLGNIIAPGSEMAITFKIGLPEPCVGDFTDGQIYFWGEAI